MRKCSKLMWFLILVGTGTSQAADVLSETEREAIEGVIERVVAAGFPDGKAALWYHGKLQVRATSGPAGEAPLLPCDASDQQDTMNGEVAYHFTFAGLHGHFPEPSAASQPSAAPGWLIAFSYRYAPRAGDSVTETELVPVDMHTLTADAAKAHPFDTAKQAGEWLAANYVADRPRMTAAMDRLVPVSYLLGLDANAWPAAVVVLHHAGWADATLAALTIADQRARSFWQLRFWREPDVAFDPTGAYRMAKTEEKAWFTAHPTLVLEPPEVAIRRALFRICRAQLQRDDGWLSPEVAAACALVCCDPNDPQDYKTRIAALVKACRLPVLVAADADLVTRLQSWEGTPRQPRMSVTAGSAKDQKNGSVSISTTFAAPEAAYVPTSADTEALVALLDDDRPSRWIDFSGARTVGDNAWRALAELFAQDPRALAGLPVDPPWTAAERHAAATAFRSWWQRHRVEHLTPTGASIDP